MTGERFVDINSRPYRLGVQDANNALDRSTAKASDLLVCAEWAAERAHKQEDLWMYHLAKGFADTVREFIEGQGQ